MNFYWKSWSLFAEWKSNILFVHRGLVSVKNIMPVLNFCCWLRTIRLWQCWGYCILEDCKHKAFLFSKILAFLVRLLWRSDSHYRKETVCCWEKHFLWSNILALDLLSMQLQKNLSPKDVFSIYSIIFRASFLVQVQEEPIQWFRSKNQLYYLYSRPNMWNNNWHMLSVIKMAIFPSIYHYS